VNPFAALMVPMVDRPCVDRRERPRVAPVAPQWPPRAELPVIANPWKLTPMQCAVMGLQAKGMGKKAIGLELSINPKTVDSHRERIMTKMDVATKRQALDLWNDWARARP
jgi:DNA-binding NarL/FixJ family response regulator